MKENLVKKLHQVLNESKKYILGQNELLESIVAALVCEGHLLIEGMPGLGKTMSVVTMSNLCNLSFKRIQFTPDLLPSDLIGTMIYSQKNEEFTTKFGPIFTQLLLADEINRSPAKVQAALLEAMAERQVTIGDQTHKLTSPFVVLATQNPIEQEGTYTLPEAQLDRFMMKVFVDYPSLEAEKNILTLESGTFQKIESILTSDDLNNSRKYIESIYVDPKVNDYIVRCVTATRPSSSLFLSKFDGAITAGASPRASLWLNKLSRFNAFVNNKEFVTPEDVIKYIPFVLGHRVTLSYEAQVDNMNSRDITAEIANTLV